MIYLDNSATSPISRAAKDKISRVIDTFGNPSSVHFVGLDAARLVDEARDALFDAFIIPKYRRIDGKLPIGAGKKDAYRFFFTSGGSESDNTAVFGLLGAKKFRSLPRILTTDSEHPALLEPIAAAERMGLCEYRLIPTKGGRLDLDFLERELTPNTLLVSIMAANNETGALYDLAAAFSLTHRLVPNAVCHTDAVQAFTKTKFTPMSIGADLVSISGHKFGAPKGVGGLLVSNSLLVSKRLAPLVYGGGQEGGMRAGTENLLGIAAMGAACRDACEHFEESVARVSECREAFCEALCSSPIANAVSVNLPENYLPHIISLTLRGVRSETLVRALSGQGICISNGSACSSHGNHRTIAGMSVLEAFGLSPSDADSTVRISMSGDNTKSELIDAARAIADLVPTLAHK